MISTSFLWGLLTILAIASACWIAWEVLKEWRQVYRRLPRPIVIGLAGLTALGGLFLLRGARLLFNIGEGELHAVLANWLLGVVTILAAALGSKIL